MVEDSLPGSKMSTPLKRTHDSLLRMLGDIVLRSMEADGHYWYALGVEPDLSFRSSIKNFVQEAGELEGARLSVAFPMKRRMRLRVLGTGRAAAETAPPDPER